MTIFLIIAAVLIALMLITALAIFIGKAIALGHQPPFDGGPR